jgi:hypothetical protein
MVRAGVEGSRHLARDAAPGTLDALKRVRGRSHDIGYGVREDMDALLTAHRVDD